MRLWMFVACAALLVGCGGTTLGGAHREGYTLVPTNKVMSVETYYNTGAITLGDGWGLVWVEGDEFAYCIAAHERAFLEDIATLRQAGEDLVIFYHDGGNTTGGCTTGIPETYKLRVTGVAALTDDLDLTRARP